MIWSISLQFAQIKETTFVTAAMQFWSSTTANTDKYWFGHDTYNARCLGPLLLSSLSDEFSLVNIARVNHLLQHDGPLILWTICHHTNCNNDAFVETTKQNIRKVTLSQFNDDTAKYLRSFRITYTWLRQLVAKPCTIKILSHISSPN